MSSGHSANFRIPQFKFWSLRFSLILLPPQLWCILSMFYITVGVLYPVFSFFIYSLSVTRSSKIKKHTSLPFTCSSTVDVEKCYFQDHNDFLLQNMILHCKIQWTTFFLALIFFFLNIWKFAYSFLISKSATLSEFSFYLSKHGLFPFICASFLYQWFSALAIQHNHLGTFEKYSCEYLILSLLDLMMYGVLSVHLSLYFSIPQLLLTNRSTIPYISLVGWDLLHINILVMYFKFCKWNAELINF